jgi:hypothetical protein
MSPRIVIAVLAVATLGAASVPVLAQTPEQSPAAMAAPKAPSESATPNSGAMAAPPSEARSFTADRSAANATSGKAALTAPGAIEKK